MILQLKKSQRKGWYETDVVEALKQGIVALSRIEDSAHQFKKMGLKLFLLWCEVTASSVSLEINQVF